MSGGGGGEGRRGPCPRLAPGAGARPCTARPSGPWRPAGRRRRGGARRARGPGGGGPEMGGRTELSPPPQDKSMVPSMLEGRSFLRGPNRDSVDDSLTHATFSVQRPGGPQTCRPGATPVRLPGSSSSRRETSQNWEAGKELNKNRALGEKQTKERSRGSGGALALEPPAARGSRASGLRAGPAPGGRAGVSSAAGQGGSTVVGWRSEAQGKASDRRAGRLRTRGDGSAGCKDERGLCAAGRSAGSAVGARSRDEAPEAPNAHDCTVKHWQAPGGHRHPLLLETWWFLFQLFRSSSG